MLTIVARYIRYELQFTGRVHSDDRYMPRGYPIGIQLVAADEAAVAMRSRGCLLRWLLLLQLYAALPVAAVAAIEISL